MSEHTPLTEAERAVLEAVNYEAEGRGLGDGHPLFAAVERILAARTSSTATADTGLRERVEALADELDQEAHRYERAEPIHWRALVEATRDHAKRLRGIAPSVRSGGDPGACPVVVRCPDRALCPPVCQEAGSRESPAQRPTRHPLDATAAPTTDTGARDE